MINDCIEYPASTDKGKAVIYKYLHHQGLPDKADNFIKTTTKKEVDAAKIDKTIQDLIIEMEKFSPNRTSKEKKHQKYAKEYDYKLAAIKKLAGK